MADNFKYDVFLSHSSKDLGVVHAVAERLRANDLRVWFDDREQEYTKLLDACRPPAKLFPSKTNRVSKQVVTTMRG